MDDKSFMTVMQQVPIYCADINYCLLLIHSGHCFLKEKLPLLPSLGSQENDPLFLGVLWFSLSTKKFRCPYVISNVFLLIWRNTENSFLAEWHVVSSGSVLKTTESIWDRDNLRAFSPPPGRWNLLRNVLLLCYSQSRVMDAGQWWASKSAQAWLWERMNQVINMKNIDRNVWWDLHYWMASRLTLMTKWETTIYRIFTVFSIWLFSPPTFYFELLPEVRVAIRCLNIFKCKVEIQRWCSQFLIKTFQERQERTISSSSEWGSIARANLMTEGRWNFKAT